MSAHLEKVEMAARDLIRYYCPEYVFKWSRSFLFKGHTWQGELKKEIHVSKHFAEVNSFESMLLTVIHEIAHVLSPVRGHNKVWRKLCIDLGGDGLTYWSQSGETIRPTKI